MYFTGRFNLGLLALIGGSLWGTLLIESLHSIGDATFWLVRVGLNVSQAIVNYAVELGFVKSCE
jgi:hypothetical protein